MLADRIKAIEAEVVEVKSAINSSRRSRRMIMLFFLLFIAAICGLFYQLFARVQSEEFQNELTAKAQAHLTSNADNYTREIQGLVDNSSPVLVAALRSRAEEDMPRYTRALNEQRDVFLKNLEPKLEDLVTNRYAEILVSFEDVLVEEFPDAADPQTQARLQKNLRAAMSKLVKKYYVDSLQRNLEEIFAAWDSFPPADPPEKGAATLPQQLIGALMEMLTQRISRPPGQSAVL